MFPFMNHVFFRFGMKQLQNCYELRDPRAWLPDPATPNSSSCLEKRKLEWETEHAQQEVKRQRLEPCQYLVTYPSQLASRQWTADQPGGPQLDIWRPMAALLEEIHLDMAATLLYRTETMVEEDLPPVHVKKERKGPVSSHWGRQLWPPQRRHRPLPQSADSILSRRLPRRASRKYGEWMKAELYCSHPSPCLIDRGH